jgi:pre-mRNA-splicing factor ISY1
MARNREKAASMLNRWTMLKLHGIDDDTVFQRPVEVKEVKKLNEAETWRRQCLKEIDDKVDIIQNPSLGEHRTRDLNDEINRLMKELKIWQQRIIELNGPDYSKITQESSKSEVININGYKYFGAARNLPGVRELYEKSVYKAPKKSRNDLQRSVDAFYYGFYKVDQSMEELEKEAENEQIQKEIKRFKEAEQFIGEKNKIEILEIQIPSKEEIQKEIVEKKKIEILNKY